MTRSYTKDLDISGGDGAELKKEKRREKAFLDLVMESKLTLIRVGSEKREILTEKHFQIVPGSTYDNGHASRPLVLPITCKIHTLGALKGAHHAQSLLYDLQVKY